VNTGREFKQAEKSSQKMKGMIKNETQPPPKFHASEKKQLMCDIQISME
jgi:hypothetical protein